MARRRLNGVVSGGELYTLSQIKVRLGVSDAAMRQLRRKGLPIIRVGRRGYASGKQVIEFFERLLNDGQSMGDGHRPNGTGAAVARSCDGRPAAEVVGDE